MRTFRCDVCGQVLYFENSICTSCGSTLAFLPGARVLAAVVEGADGRLRRPKQTEFTYRHCNNRSEYAACNWAVRIQDDQALCECCRLNDVIPDLSDARSRELWVQLESAKRRLLFTLHDLGLPVVGGPGAPVPTLRFRFMADQPEPHGHIHTGHAAGVITINLAEADDAHREKVREQLGENYRTVLGHLRHESGHYFWDRLVAPDSARLERSRQLFGDERADYAAALATHYEKGPAAAAPDGFVSAYCTMHPAEDWAETWAHYLHMIDTLETAAEFGLSLWSEARPVGTPRAVRPSAARGSYFDDLLSAWTALTVALNSLSRSMGLRDAYPFALTQGVVDKLRFVHDLIDDAARLEAPAA